MDLGSLTATYGVLAIFAVMLLKESGIPIPIPSDLIMIAAGVQLASGAYAPLPLLLAVLVAILVGGSIQFTLSRTAGRAVVFRLAAFAGIRAETLELAIARLRNGGARAVFVGLNIPGARAAVIPAAGLAGLAFSRFTLGTVSGSTVFYAWHVALGYVVGPTATQLLERYTLPLLAVLALLAVAGLVLWRFVRRRPRPGDPAPFAAWTEAACLACLAVTALDRPRASS